MGWTAALMAFQVVSSVAGYMNSNAQADAAQDQARRQAEANNKSAWDNYYAQKSQLEEQSNQITASASNELSERAKSAAIEQARIRTASAESGVAGLSVGTLIADSAFQEGADRGGIITNFQNKQKQNNNELKGANARAASQSNSGYNEANNTIQRANSSRQSLLSTGLQIAGSVGSYGVSQGWGKTLPKAPSQGTWT